MTRTAILAGAAALAVSTLSGPASAAERSWSPESFTGVRVAGAYNVIVDTGSGPAVRAEGDEDTLERMDVYVDDGVLVIKPRKDGVRTLFSGWKNDDKVRVLVNTRRLDYAAVAGSGDLKVDRMEGDRVALKLAGSGDLGVGTIDSDRSEISIAGSGNVSAAGSCVSGEVKIAGSGDVTAPSFVCRDLTVKISGSGDVRARATGTADIRVSGSGDVTVTGGAECRKKVSGSGDVRCS